MKDFARSGLVLKGFRNKLNFTQSEFVGLLNSKVHVQFCSNWERGLCLPPTHAMKRLIDFKGFPKDLFKSMLKEDLFESHWRKYEPVKAQKQRTTC